MDNSTDTTTIAPSSQEKEETSTGHPSTTAATDSIDDNTKLNTELSDDTSKNDPDLHTTTTVVNPADNPTTTDITTTEANPLSNDEGSTLEPAPTIDTNATTDGSEQHLLLNSSGHDEQYAYEDNDESKAINNTTVTTMNDDEDHDHDGDGGDQRPKSSHSAKSLRDTRFKHSPLKRNPSAKAPAQKAVSSQSMSRDSTTSKTPSKRLPSPTKAITPKFHSAEEIERRKQLKESRVNEEKARSEQINNFRNEQRKKLKQDYELEREKVIAQEELYKKKRAMQWRKRLAKSPFSVDLVADKERVQEEQSVRQMFEMKKKIIEAKKLNELKSAMILNQLVEAQKRSELSASAQRRLKPEINSEF